MNDRIKELARKAGLIAPYGSDHEGLRDFDYRLFAKLIIEESAEIADANYACSGLYIKEHFGIQK